DGHLRPPGHDGVLQIGARLRCPNDAQQRRRLELLLEPAALLRPALIENNCGDVLRIHVDDAEENQLEDRHEDREHERGAITHHLRQLFAKDGDETVHARPPAAAARSASTSLPRVSVSCTNTSSSVGSISVIVTSLIPNDSRSCSTCSSETFASMS